MSTLESITINKDTKVAKLKANRPIDEKIVKKYKESLKEYGLLAPALYMDASEVEAEIVDFKTEEPIANKDGYIVLIEGCHRFQAHLELVEKGNEYEKVFKAVKPVNDVDALKALAQVNTITTKWTTGDIARGADAINPNAPRLLKEIVELMSRGYSLNAASLWLTFTRKVTKEDIDKALNGDYSQLLHNEAEIDRRKMVLKSAEDKFGINLCKTRTMLAEWVSDKYIFTEDANKPTFADDMITFIDSIKEDLNSIKGKRGGRSKAELIKQRLNELWDSRHS